VPVKPIDLQTNIAKMHEVAKGEASKSAAIVEGQHVLGKETGEKSRLVNTRLDENKKLEKIAIKREEKRKRKGIKRRKRDKEIIETEESEEREIFKDDKLGIVIDVRK